VSVATAAKIKLLSESQDFAGTVHKEIGDLSKLEVFGARILVAIYFRPEKTKGGILRPGINIEEDAYQSKVGLVLKIGPDVFVSDENADFHGETVKPGDYVFYRASDGFPLSHNGIPCRILRDEQIMMKIDDPAEWF
jgi:co-chaperonin GroES (HSP10)